MLTILIFSWLQLLFPYLPETELHESPDVTSIYSECKLGNYLTLDIFKMALEGMDKIDSLKNKKIITIIDYSKPSAKERFFVIDLENRKLLYHTLVAHGKNSGEYSATKFSNENGSLKSCLGFFITGETYSGKQGYSLRLDGLEPGFNDKARKRAIVIHGADYVSREVANEYGRLGKSWGCPALPLNLNRQIIDKISDGSLVFVYANDPSYLKGSQILNTTP